MNNIKDTNNIIYVIEITNLSYSGLKILNVKIGKTTNLKATLRQYRRTSPEAQILNLWESNFHKSLSECEKGVHKIAEKYAYERKGETFIFLQESYTDFEENVNLLLKNIPKEKVLSREVQKEYGESTKYNESDHLVNASKENKALYEQIKKRILNLGDNIKVESKKHYISFISNTIFADIHLQKSQIKLWINLSKGELFDPERVARDVSNLGHWGNGDYEVIINHNTDLDYLMNLIEQSYQKHIS